MVDQNIQRTLKNKSLFRNLKKAVTILAILALVMSIVVAICIASGLYYYPTYWSQTAPLSKAQNLTVYFDDQFKQGVAPEDIPLYASEIRKGKKFNFGSACPFTVKLVFTLPDKHTCNVLIGTDGCGQLRLPSGMQAKFPYGGKLAELEKEYITSQNNSPQGDML